MKAKEREILSVLNTVTPDTIKESKREYSRFDGYNKAAFFEIKHRNKYYENTFIEFDKFAYNLQLAKLYEKVFIYVVSMAGKVYLFNITELENNKYNFNFEWVKLPAFTEYENSQNKWKFTGYINIKQAFKTLNTN